MPLYLFSEDVVIKAMKDEISRTVAKLQLENLQKPYFVSYYVYDSSSSYIEASFGDIKESGFYFWRNAKVDLRIGSMNFDNSNYITDYYRYKPVIKSLPEEEDYDSVRKSLWLMTDEAYKDALEKYAQKEAYRKKKNITEIYGDLSPEKVENYTEKRDAFETIDMEKYKKWAQKVSAKFLEFKNINDADLYINYDIVRKRFCNSEGSSYIVDSSYFDINVVVSMQNEYGYKISDNKRFLFANIPNANMDKIEEEIYKYAKEMNDSYKAEKIDYYVGPALFEDEAAGEFFNQLFVRNISFSPKPWADKDEWLKYYYDIPKLTDRITKRVLPGFISVYDNPLEKKYQDTDLVGYYPIDNEAVKPSKLELVKKGRLENIYASRRPDKDIKQSNGHGRATVNSFVYPFSGNVFVNSEKTMPYKELKNKLISMAKEQELDYVIVVKKVSRPQSNDKIIGDPVLAYKLDVKTLKETPINISDFDGIGLRALRDIVATSNEYFTYNFYQEMPYVYSNGSVPSSIVMPKSILIQEIELKKTDKKPDRMPYMTRP